MVADLHLTLLKPACRADGHWMNTQAHYLQWLREQAGKPALPIICAGDIFDRWNAPPELINFALEHLPDGMLCVPGQHDLPNHNIEDMHRSGYGVLERAKKIVNLRSDGSVWAEKKFVIYGAGWNQPIPKAEGVWHLPRIVAIHKYCWSPGKQYPGAPKDSYFANYEGELKGYDIAVFGDNHKGFTATAGKCDIINCGGFIRRKSDEINYQPTIGVLYSDLTLKRRKIPTGWDKFNEGAKDRPEASFNMRDFLETLEGLGEHGMDFREAVQQHLKTEDIDPATKQMIVQAML